METTTDTAAAYARAIEQAARIVRGIDPQHLDSPTPCKEWNTRQLLNHFVGSNLMMAAVGSGKTMGSGISGPEAVSALGDVIGDDPAGAYESASSAAKQAFNAPGALERVWQLPFGEMPGAVALNIHLMETITHTWDLAKTTGQLDTLDPELAETGEAVARGLVGEGFRNEKGDPFGPEVTVSPGASAYDRLAGFVGRTP